MLKSSSRSVSSSVKTLVRSIPALDPLRRAYHRGRDLIEHSRTPNYYARALGSNFYDPSRYLFLHWWVSKNFGDAVSLEIAQALSCRTALAISQYPKAPWHPCFSAVGSVLQFRAPSLDVWGSGFIEKSARFYAKPRKVHAVRGPLTRRLVLDQGIDCLDVYGDPAVFIFDKFSDLARSGQYKVGLVPHYYDATHPDIARLAEDDRVLIIDVLKPVAEIARAFAECHVVVSSSLHGLILADAMGIPSRWLGVSHIVQKGGFKFQDYFASVGREESEPLDITALSVPKALQQAHCRLVPFSRERLLDACPFRAASISSLQQVSFSDEVLGLA